MSVWLVRAGRAGEREDFALDNGVAVIGWDELQDLSDVKSRTELRTLMETVLSDKQKAAIANYASQIWAFRERIQVGDLIVLPLKSRSAVAVGTVKGPYRYRPENPTGARHTREVEWIRKDIPRSEFDPDILYSLGAYMTVCQIQRNRAEERIKALLGDRRPPSLVPDGQREEEAVAGEELPLDLEQYARDQLVGWIGQRFRGHGLAELVAAILAADGYHTRQSPPGPDGGVDIVAGRGPMGFESPRLCVQVKSGEGPVDVRVLRELQGVMSAYKAEQGLLVAWGGFKQSVYNEARQLFFNVRLWDQGELVQALLERYENLPRSIQAELPLKKIWVLVHGE